jgi:ribosomal protein L2
MAAGSPAPLAPVQLVARELVTPRCVFAHEMRKVPSDCRATIGEVGTTSTPREGKAAPSVGAVSSRPFVAP